jgi:hypothetical protein
LGRQALIQRFFGFDRAEAVICGYVATLVEGAIPAARTCGVADGRFNVFDIRDPAGAWLVGSAAVCQSRGAVK